MQIWNQMPSSQDKPPVAAGGLIGAGEPPPFELIENVPSLPVLVVCDHASRTIPRGLDDLGVGQQYLEDHIAWDIGAGAVARSLANALGLPAVLAGYSRLVVDCNRNLDDPTAFPEISDGIVVPGNQALTQEQRQFRADAFYWPYHHAIRDQIRNLESIAAAPALLAMHSFTPTLGVDPRPWHFGIMWDKDSRIALPLMENLAKGTDILVGNNRPYSGRHPADFTIDHHAEAEGLPHSGIEVRQDLVETAPGVDEWSARLAEALLPILSDTSLYMNRAGSA